VGVGAEVVVRAFASIDNFSVPFSLLLVFSLLPADFRFTVNDIMNAMASLTGAKLLKLHHIIELINLSILIQF